MLKSLINCKSRYIIAILVVATFSCTKSPVDTGNDVDEERILFVRISRDFSEICTLKPDGSDIQVIAQHDHNNEHIRQGYQQARWSPDKTKIVIMGGPNDSNEFFPLWLMDMEGNLLYKLIWNGYLPIWSSDGENVIYARRRGYFSVIYDIYKININSLQEDTIIVAEVGEPGYNSGYIFHVLDIVTDDTKLLLNEIYTYKDSSGTQIDDDPEIIIYDYLNNQKIYLTDNDLGEGWGRISPDGNSIFYWVKDIGTIYSNNLYSMKSNGDSLLQLTFGSTDVYSFLTLSPNGKKLAYSKADFTKGYNPYADIFKMDIQSGAIHRLTNTAQDSITNYVMDWK